MTSTAGLTNTGYGMFLCARCHLQFRAEYTRGHMVHHSCGKLCSGIEIKGREGHQPCNAKCMGSTSGVCECQCAGKNHGGGRS